MRFGGHIMAEDTADGRTIWKVRVVDEKSHFNGRKLIVASTHGGITLARGLIVDFEIGFLNDLSKTRVPRAVDVGLITDDSPEEYMAHQIYEAILEEIEQLGQETWESAKVTIAIRRKNPDSQPMLDISNVEIR